jgi:pimeloyl-ACP methyl ester carboxylesterase
LTQALLILIFIIMLFRWFEHSQVYHPSRTMDSTGAELGRPFENVFFKTSDGIELNGWFFPANTNSSRAQFAVLICHGNAGNISHRLALYRALLSTGVAVFAFDYRGYGRSKGRPGEEGTYLDAQAAYQWLAKKGFADIIVLGESLGSGVASELCLREKMRGLILLSAFTSIPDIGKEFFPWLPAKLLGSIKYDTRAKLPRLKIHVLVIHSRMDEIAAFHHAERNFSAANEPKLFWEISGEHNDALDDPARFVEGIEKFLPLIENQKL